MKTHNFAVCISNTGYEASLEFKKIYEVIEDAVAANHGQIRVIDESGEDYLFPANFFARIQLSPDLQKQLVGVA